MTDGITREEKNVNENELRERMFAQKNLARQPEAPVQQTAFNIGNAPGGMERQDAPYVPDIPTIELQLPSGTKLYPEFPGGTIKLKALEQKEMDILSTDHLIKKNRAFEKAIDSCIVSPRASSNTLIAGDRIYVLFKLFEISKGTSEYVFDQVCPRCNKRTTGIRVDFNDIKVNRVELEKNSFVTPPLPISKRVVTYHMINGFERQTVEDKIRIIMQSTAAAKLIDSTSTELLLASVDEVEGLTKNQKDDFVRHMILGDSLALREHMNDSSPGSNPVFQFSCVNCPHEEELVVPVQNSFFSMKGRI